MALDTRYRPRRFEDVIGQEATVKVLRQFVNSGSGFHQSYLFCGGHGSGKTTLARILSRSLLCENPKGGDPCDECNSCRSILERGTSECFTEFDAATNSGKEDIKALTDAVQYDTFSGKRRLYLIDESHRLSPAALDALLKPMEDTASGSDDKLLVCLFCTTEPEKMKATIFSRCAPAFLIRQVSPEDIATRLGQVCEAEGIPHEREALILIAEAVECHIRDALKSVEGVSMLGPVDVANVKSYLRLNANASYLRILAYVGQDLTKVLSEVLAIQQMVSPATAYERLADLAMLAYRHGLGVGRLPSFWSAKHVDVLVARHGPFLVRMAQVFATRPGHPSFAMLECDLTMLHLQRRGEATGVPSMPVRAVPMPVVTSPAPPAAPTTVPPESARPAEAQVQEAGTVPAPAPAAPATAPAVARVTEGGVYVDPRGVNRRKSGEKSSRDGSLPPLDPAEFRKGLGRLVAEMSVDVRGRPSR